MPSLPGSAGILACLTANGTTEKEKNSLKLSRQGYLRSQGSIEENCHAYKISVPDTRLRRLRRRGDGFGASPFPGGADRGEEEGRFPARRMERRRLGDDRAGS